MSKEYIIFRMNYNRGPYGKGDFNHTRKTGGFGLYDIL